MIRYFPALLSILALTACVGTEPAFNNPHLVNSKHGIGAYMKLRYFGDEEWADWPSHADLIPIAPTDTASLTNPDPDIPQATWIGHSTVLIQYRGVNVLTDPIFSKRASPVQFAGPERITKPSIAISTLPHIDLVVISHNHYDHLDKLSVKALADKVERWAVPLGLDDFIRRVAGENAKVTEFSWWQEQVEPKYQVTATPSQHWSGRSPFDRFDTLWAAWTVQIENFTFWFGGDTGYNAIQFKEIGKKFDTIHLGLIPIGAYAPRSFMKDMHVNPMEAVQIHEDIGAAFSIGIHWGTFPLTSEAPQEPPKKLTEALASRGHPKEDFRALAVGETIQLDKP